MKGPITYAMKLIHVEKVGQIIVIVQLIEEHTF